jgi:hypothetical protein
MSDPPDFYLKKLAVLHEYDNWNPLHTVHKVNARSKYIWGNQHHCQQVVLTQAELVNKVV